MLMELKMTKYHPHIPVMLDTTVNHLITNPDGIYIDGTLGGGGHSKEILSRLSDKALLFGIDQDREAHEAALKNIGDDDRFIPLHGNFAYIKTLVDPEYHGKIDGILFDFGVSTHQIKDPERGFSFQHDGPLDMRMSELTGISAYQVVNDYPYEKLRDIIFHYGEERLSRQIASAIIENRPIETTGELRKVIEGVVYGKHAIKSVARTFQGIRIEVNRELEVIENALSDSLEILKEGGRIVTLSYHSLEDRPSKNFFKSGNFKGKIEKDFYGNPVRSIKPITKKPLTPSEEEIEQNPAARSAKLRVAEKITGGE